MTEFLPEPQSGQILTTYLPQDADPVFLACLARTGRLHESATAAGVPFRLVKDLMKSNPDFASRVEDAIEIYAEQIHARLEELAMGRKEKVYFRGEEVPGAYREVYDSQLLQMLAKAYIPKFKDKLQVDANHRVAGVLVVGEVKAAKEWEAEFGGA